MAGRRHEKNLKSDDSPQDYFRMLDLGRVDLKTGVFGIVESDWGPKWKHGGFLPQILQTAGRIDHSAGNPR